MVDMDTRPGDAGLGEASAESFLRQRRGVDLVVVAGLGSRVGIQS